MTALDWWPDWRGADCAIVASGPSVKKAEVLALQGRTKVIAIKENWRLAPFADVVYGCDAAWWRNEVGLPKFNGLKISATRRTLAEAYSDIRFVNVLPPVDELVVERPGTIGSGGNSGFQCLNLAVQWGATRILLLGFDVSARSGVHWYGRNSGPGRTNPDEINFRRWRAAFERTPAVLDRLGVVVVNASANSSLTCYPRASVAQTLDEWAKVL